MGVCSKRERLRRPDFNPASGRCHIPLRCTGLPVADALGHALPTNRDPSPTESRGFTSPVDAPLFSSAGTASVRFRSPSMASTPRTCRGNPGVALAASLAATGLFAHQDAGLCETHGPRRACGALWHTERALWASMSLVFVSRENWARLHWQSLFLTQPWYLQVWGVSMQCNTHMECHEDPVCREAIRCKEGEPHEHRQLQALKLLVWASVRP